MPHSSRMEQDRCSPSPRDSAQRNRQATAPAVAARPERLSDIVENGLCVGCGLCQAIAGKDRIEFVITPEGRERPVERRKISPDDWQRILRTCPGTRVEGASSELCGHDAESDRIWGPYHRVCLGHAADPDVRFRAASGGVLTALAAYLVESGKVSFILQVRASLDRPVRTETVMSEDGASVVRSTGSRYGPATPLASIMDALDRDEPFAFVGKPCDVGALRLLAREDGRVARRCKAMLALVCGGAPEFRKTGDLLEELGLREDEISLLRYRGYGNPGRTRIETRDGRAFEKTYLEMWEEESQWCIQNRCKICPDAIGEVADVAAADYWPGGAPSGEDAGFNSMIARTPAGRDLLRDAEAAGAIRIVRELTIARHGRHPAPPGAQEGIGMGQAGRDAGGGTPGARGGESADKGAGAGTPDGGESGPGPGRPRPGPAGPDDGAARHAARGDGWSKKENGAGLKGRTSSDDSPSVSE